MLAGKLVTPFKLSRGATADLDTRIILRSLSTDTAHPRGAGTPVVPLTIHKYAVRKCILLFAGLPRSPPKADRLFVAFQNLDSSKNRFI